LLLSITFPVTSSVSLVSPNVTSKSYSLIEDKNWILFVASPKARARTPVANGSRVPECPIFFILVNLLTFLMTSKEVIPFGLSINTQPLDKELDSLIISLNLLELF